MDDNEESEEDSMLTLFKLLATPVEIVGAWVTVVRSLTETVDNLS